MVDMKEEDTTKENLCESPTQRQYLKLLNWLTAPREQG
jgi:hypothetical protein